MPLDLDLAPDPGDLAIVLDEERGALDTHILAPIHALFLPDTIGLENGLVLVGGQDHPEIVLGDKLVVSLYGIGRDADDHGAGGRKLVRERGEIECLGGAAAGIVFRVEIKYHFLACQFGQRHVSAAIAWQIHIWRRCAFNQFVHYQTLSPVQSRFRR